MKLKATNELLIIRIRIRDNKFCKVDFRSIKHGCLVPISTTASNFDTFITISHENTMALHQNQLFTRILY